MLRIKNIIRALVLLVAVFFLVPVNSSRADGFPGNGVQLIASESQLQDQVVTFQEFYEPPAYKWEGTWDPRWNNSGLPKSDRDYDRSTGVTQPREPCER